MSIATELVYSRVMAGSPSPGRAWLYADDAENGVNDALEAAAQKCDELMRGYEQKPMDTITEQVTAIDCAAAIRAMKEMP